MSKPPRSRRQAAPSGIAAVAALSAVLGVGPVAGQESSTPPRESEWAVDVGLGVAVDGGGSEHDPNPVGAGAHAGLTRTVGSGLRLGIQWDGAWFGGRITTEKRMQLTAVAEMTVPGTPFWIRAGPGVGFASVVDVERPPPGTIGDAQVSVGDQSVWGLLAEVGARLPLTDYPVVESVAGVLYQRAPGFHDDSFTMVTVVFGARLRLGR